MSQLSDLPPGLDPTWKVYLLLVEESVGFFVFELSDNAGRVHDVTVPLDGAHVQLLLVLNAVMAQDADLPWIARGWRHPKTLGWLYGEKTGYPVDASTIRTYLSRIQGQIRKAVKALGVPVPVPQLFERQRGKGARLAFPRLEIIDRTAAGGIEFRF